MDGTYKTWPENEMSASDCSNDPICDQNVHNVDSVMAMWADYIVPSSYNCLASLVVFSCHCCLTCIATESMMTIMENTHAYNVQKAVDQTDSVSVSVDTMRF